MPIYLFTKKKISFIFSCLFSVIFLSSCGSHKEGSSSDLKTITVSRQLDDNLMTDGTFKLTIDCPTLLPDGKSDPLHGKEWKQNIDLSVSSLLPPPSFQVPSTSFCIISLASYIDKDNNIYLPSVNTEMIFAWIYNGTYYPSIKSRGSYSTQDQKKLLLNVNVENDNMIFSSIVNPTSNSSQTKNIKTVPLTINPFSFNVPTSMSFALRCSNVFGSGKDWYQPRVTISGSAGQHPVEQKGIYLISGYPCIVTLLSLTDSLGSTIYKPKTLVALPFTFDAIGNIINPQTIIYCPIAGSKSPTCVNFSVGMNGLVADPHYNIFIYMLSI